MRNFSSQAKHLEAIRKGAQEGASRAVADRLKRGLPVYISDRQGGVRVVTSSQQTDRKTA